MILLEIVVVAILILVNGFLAMSEIALVSSRPARLNALAAQGVAGARQAARLVTDPARFLSTVQIGITLVGILSGAFSGATLGLRLAEWLGHQGLPVPAAEMLGIGSVVVAITYCALIAGELVPKQIALQDPETVAARVAPVMVAMARGAAPLVWLLSVSAKAVLRAAGQPLERQSRVTDEEIEALIAEAEGAGLIEPDERRMIAGVMRLGDREAGRIMSPRAQVDRIDVRWDADKVRRTLVATQHSHLPATDGDPDRAVGLVRTRELLSAMLLNEPLDPGRLIRRAPVVSEHASALHILATLRKADVPLALVEDDAGRFAGVISPVDILNAIAGVVGVETLEEPAVVRRDDGSWLIDGALPVQAMAARLGIAMPPDLEDQTVAAFTGALFERLPRTGEAAHALGWRFEVVDLDGRRIDKVLAAREKSDAK